MLIVKILFLINFCDSLKSTIIRDGDRVLVRKKRLTGKPHLANCMEDFDDAKQQYFMRMNGFKFSIIWNNSSEAAERPLSYYSFTIKALKWSSTEDPLTSPGTNFEVSHFVHGTTGKVEVLPPFSLEPGIYQIIVKATAKPSAPVTLAVYTEKCYFVIKAMPPVVVLDGGTYRQVPPNRAVQLNAKGSMNLDAPLDKNNINTMTFLWSCTRVGTSCVLGGNQEPTITIFADKLQKGVITITLTVKTSYGENATVSQAMEVVPNAARLKISCEKNCPPVTTDANPQSITFFRGSCEDNCNEVKVEDYEWKIEPSDDSDFIFDPNTQTHFGARGPKFIVVKDVFKPGAEYLITLRLKSTSKRVGKMKMAVKFAEVPKIQSCEIRPPQGKSLHTSFQLFCIEEPPPDRNNYYQLFVDEDLHQSVVNGYYPDVFTMRFLLPPSADRTFTVKISKNHGAAITLEVYPDVQSASSNKTSNEAMDIYNRFLHGRKGSVPDLIKSNKEEDKKRGIEAFQALVNEMIHHDVSEAEIKQFATDMTFAVLNAVTQSPPTDAELLITVTDSISNLIKHYGLTVENPKMARMASEVCKVMIQHHAQEIKKQRFPLNSESQFSRVGSILTKCLESNIHESFDLLAPTKYNITIGKLPPSEGLVEHYPDYIDMNDNYKKHLEELSRLTDNVVNATATAAKSFAFTTALGETFAKSLGNFSEILVVKDVGSAMAQTKISMFKITLVPSHDFDSSEHAFDFLLAIWAKDLMWWNHAHTRVSTNIASLQFWHSNCRKRIRHFFTPVNLLMEVNVVVNDTSHAEVKIVESNVSFPDGYQEFSDKNISRYIRVHRIDLLPVSVLHIHFFNISATDRFDVVLTKFEFPSARNFRANETVQGNSHMRIFNYEKYGVWGYVGVLPSRKEPPISTAKILYYNVKFVSAYCIRWDSPKRAWVPECKPGLGSTVEVINCECNRFSVLAGYIQNTQSIIQELNYIEIELELQTCYVIFGTLVATFMLYYLLFMLVIFKSEIQIYYCADNNKDHRYAYIITIRTENRKNAGTTSYVMIRLHGTKRSSSPHVLNYPDPEMKILQREGEDTFILTTEGHLGSIEEIELWYDCSGPSPSWHCRDIVVYDMQKNEQWYFKIKKYFSVTKGITYLAITPTSEEGEGISNRFRICNHFHTWQLWSNEKNFTFISRLTVVLSNVLMIYSFILWMVGIPSLEPRDCIDPYDKYYLPNHAISSALLSSFMSFVIHILIAWSFRFSSLEFHAFKKTYTSSNNAWIYCWIFLIVLIALSTCFLTVFGFWVPLTSSLVWLTCCLLAILFEVLVLENAFIIVQTFFCKFRLTLSIDKYFKAYLNRIEAQRTILYTKFDAHMLRPWMEHLYVPLRSMQITRRRIVGQLRRGIYNDLEDLVMYGIYNIVLYIVILFNKGGLTTNCKDEVESMIEGEHTRTLAFSEIESVFQ